MLPPGRRRGALGSFVPLLLLAFSTILPQAAAVSGVLGIDLGTEYIKAVLVKPGIPLEIVLTKDSKRKEQAAVAFKPAAGTSSTTNDVFPERAYGSDAIALAPRFPGDVYSNLKPLMGLSSATDAEFHSQAIAGFQSRYPSLSLQQCSPERRTVCIRSETFAIEEEAFSVEELLAMELQNIKANAEGMAGKGNVVRDAVITIPPYLTAEEKRAVETAAELAGMKVLAMVSDGLAVGVNYATSRTFPVVNDGAKPEYHLVYDMGAGSTSATVIKFQGRTVKDVGRSNKTVQEVQVVGAGWDVTLGGDALNQLILDDLLEQFVESKAIKALGASATDIKRHGRTMAKLWKEAERMRQVLSANSETQASFEGLYNADVNFRYRISRAQLEKLAAGFDQRVKTPIVQALDMAKLHLSDLDSVILHGGTTRTPFVQKTLEAIVGKADLLKTNVNSDEAAVFGAAFLAAGISPSFRVKEIRASEAAFMPVELSWISDGKERSQKLFNANSQAGKVKEVPFKFTDDFSFTFSQVVPQAAGDDKAVPIKRISTTNLTASVQQLKDKYGCETEDINTQFSIRLSSEDGLPEVWRGSVSCEGTEPKKGGVVEGVKNMFGFGSKEDQAPLNDQDELGDDASSTTEAETSTSSANAKATDGPDTSDDAKADKEAGKTAKEPEKKTQVVYVGVTEEELGLPRLRKEDIKAIKDRMRAFDSSDKNRRLREGALNELEAYSYRVRDFLEGADFIASSTDKVRDQIQKQASDTGEWIYGDGADAKLEEFRARLKELKDLVEPVLNRKGEASQRAAEIQSFREVLNQTKTMAEALHKENGIRKEQASSKSAAASESSASAATASTTTPPPEADDELDALDDTPVTSTASEEAEDPLDLFIFSDEEISTVQKKYEDAQAWFDDKLAAQEKLPATEDPVLTVAELKKRSQELQNVAIDMLTRQMASSSDPMGKKAKKAKSKSKAKSSKTKSKKGKKTSEAPSEATAEADAAGAEQVESSEKDEL